MHTLREYDILDLLHSLLDEDDSPEAIREVVLERRELAVRMLRPEFVLLSDARLTALTSAFAPGAYRSDRLEAEMEILAARRDAVTDEVTRRSLPEEARTPPAELEADARRAVQEWMMTGHPSRDLYRYLRGTLQSNI